MSLLGSTTIIWDEGFKRGNIMWKVPRNIRWNDNIVVREDEFAVFYRDGKALSYIDRPDRYALTSQNAPIYGWLLKALSGVEQQAEVYYLQKRPFDFKYGSKQPYVFRDKDFGIVNLRLFGEARWRIKEPANFISQFVGTEGLISGPQVEERIKEQIVLQIFDALGELKDRGMSIVDLPANLNEIEQIVLEKSKPHFAPFGIEVQKLSGIYITMPEEVQKAVDKRASMNITGTTYMQYQTGEAMRDAANNPSGGAAAAGVGVGAGIGMGWQMSQAMQQPGQAQPQVAAAAATRPCVKCQAPIPMGQAFCGSCGTKQAAAACAKCGTALQPGVKFCGQCGTAVQ
ncbi:MAG: SPFH domain-containing protein [Euryarchaeota archaeon]|nr:SPFH domain-containing protein [Euryarchaeota archaeon]